MKKDKKGRLEKAGWRIGTTREFLDLDDAESAIIEVRVALARALRRRRVKRHMSQAALAKQLGSSQSRVAKMEAGDPSVSLDLLVRSLFVTGSTTAEIGKAISAAYAT
jgi:ribosome-binding protein aMBF1 (putative translation factor)